jgi:hypothetical protein
MRRRLTTFCQLALASIIATTTHAAEEIQGDVPLDLVKALLGNNSPFDIRLYAGVPGHFPDIILPDSVELLGSADTGHSQQIILRAQGDGMQQRAQMIAVLESQGYLMLTQVPGANLTQTGFVTPRIIPPGMPVQLCHDAHGMLTLRITGADSTYRGGARLLPQGTPPGAAVTPFFSATAGVVPSTATTTAPATSIINVTSTGGASNPRALMGGQNCAQTQEQFRAQGGPGRINLMQYMPRMELPPAATLPGMGMQPASMSGFPAGMESRIDMSLNWELDAVLRHFADQIDQQNWQRDHESFGSMSAAGSWTRQIDEMQLFGSLRVVKTGESQYQLQFSIQSLAASGP